MEVLDLGHATFHRLGIHRPLDHHDILHDEHLIRNLTLVTNDFKKAVHQRGQLLGTEKTPEHDIPLLGVVLPISG